MKKDTTSRCGGCTLCCKLLKVDMLGKPAGQQCVNCNKDGCRIWQTRPPVCRNFQCLWYAHTKSPEALRPDRCGAFFEPGGPRVMLVASEPGAWRVGIVDALIQQCLNEGTSVIVQEPAGKGETTKHFLIAKDDDINDVWARTTKDARDRGFVK